MAFKVIKQAKEGYCLYCTNNDSIAALNLSRESVVKFFVQCAERDAKISAEVNLRFLDDNFDQDVAEENMREAMHRHSFYKHGSPEMNAKVKEILGYDPVSPDLRRQHSRFNLYGQQGHIDRLGTDRRYLQGRSGLVLSSNGAQGED